jgi:ABC-type multidrug transport system fused ATPase/permease subunit
MHYPNKESVINLRGSTAYVSQNNWL